MAAPQLIAALASALLMTGFAANEATHGGFAESMGLGHHHMTDHGGYHCAGPDDAAWQDHVAHMHGNDTTPHDHCGADHMSGPHHNGTRHHDGGHMDDGHMGGRA